MQLRIEPRAAASLRMRYASPLIATGLTLLMGFVLFAALGKNQLAAFHAFFIAPVSSLNGVAELLLKAAPLVLIATGLAVGFRANVWNIGAEGQLTIGAIVAGGMALLPAASDGPAWLLPLMIVAGAVGGMAWAAVPAFLRTRRTLHRRVPLGTLRYLKPLPHTLGSCRSCRPAWRATPTPWCWARPGSRDGGVPWARAC